MGLKELRKKYSLNQKQMAVVLGVSYAAYQRYEYGRNKLPVYQKAVAEHLEALYSFDEEHFKKAQLLIESLLSAKQDGRHRTFLLLIMRM